MAAFRSCPEILCRPESPEVILCSLSRAAPSSPSPALAPGTSPPVRRGGGHGGGVAAVCAPVFLCAGGLPSLPPAHSRFASTQEEHRPRQRKQQLSANLSQKKETLESLRKTVAFVAVNPGLPAPVCWSCGWSPLPVRGLAVSACCPVLPEAVVGASRATRGRLASTQGCHRCPLSVSLGAANGAARVVGCGRSFCLPASTQGGAPAPATKATVLRNPLQKKKTQEKPAETRCFCCRAAAGAAAALGGPPAAVRLPGAAALCRSALPAPLLCCRAAHAAAVAGGEVASGQA